MLTFTHFRNPLLILMTRLGLTKILCFVFRFDFAKRGMSILGRPTTLSLADLFAVKEPPPALAVHEYTAASTEK